ncbi:glycerol-3-phosphate acyltransferase 3-like [Micractinium conductrix]|uniref:Glycerol-3-phosphate acyltransferase 3-like n=1 Tax=Micractinium conductrix TaxID=554055 RepID=A0A2P6VIS2_9CHLO|nr:glycerol-3-phosphate acyltransferase 3-like [Micractinium conductrix]|eukprot:PSC73996.1 glycerol-3-phosphate acyltransferase 3-like [Micractinium conductrix]
MSASVRFQERQADGNGALQRTTSGLGYGLRSLKNKTFSRGDLTTFEELHKGPNSAEMQRAIDEAVVTAEREACAALGAGNVVRDVLDIASPLNDAAAAIVDDSFLRCFKSCLDDPWNWNAYLFPMWVLGVAVRNLLLFPLRLIMLLLGALIFIAGYALVGLVLKGQRLKRAERWLVQFLCQMFVVSWTGVIKYHGPRPVPQAGRVWVANHSSMIDFAVLGAYSPFAAIMQLHPGWVGVLQKRYLSSLGCLWFNRTQAQDRTLVARRMKEHVHSADSTPLLIFPEGTCVNNEYCVMFKRGAFDLDATVCPIAIKYNKIFVDAFWNSKCQSFSAHLVKLMRSWALVCDVYFLEPQTRRTGETSQQFAERVQRMIADKARLRVAPWDGYLKYYNLGEKHPDLIEKQRRVFSDAIKQHADPASGGERRRG